MSTLTATEAKERLHTLIDDVTESHDPIIIAGKRNSAVLLSEEDGSAIQETLYRTSIPGMRESIRIGLNTPAEECTKRSLTGESVNVSSDLLRSHHHWNGDEPVIL